MQLISPGTTAISAASLNPQAYPDKIFLRRLLLDHSDAVKNMVMKF
jgi:hypothetical protein